MRVPFDEQFYAEEELGHCYHQMSVMFWIPEPTEFWAAF